MLVSKKAGAKYGLIQPKQKQPTAPLQASLSVFADEDDNTEQQSGVARDVARQAARKRDNAKVAAQQAAALAEDPSVFDYDGVYDSLQEQRVQPKQAEKLERKSRYIEGLLDKAKERQREQDIVYERRLAKEREAEDHLFGDKDRFVTAAYKRKLEEDKKWLAEEKLREELEAREDVVKKGHMGDFFSNLMSNNVAFGTASSRQKDASRRPAAEPSSVPPAADHNASLHPNGEPSSLTSGQSALQHEAVQQQQRHEGDSDTQPAASRADSAGPPRAPGGEAASHLHSLGKEEQASREQQHAGDLGAALAAPAEPQPSREDKLASARERFLSRKRKGPDR